MTNDYVTDSILTYRREGGTINVAASVTDDLWHVLGKFYFQSSSHTSYGAAKWKRAVKKLVSKLEIAIRRNVLTDAIHRKSIDRHLQLIKQAIDAGPRAEPQAIAELIFLAFELMGGMPHNTEIEHANREQYFNLNAFRSVLYLQTPSQKARLIVQTASWPMFKEHYSAREIENRYYGKDKEKFLAWYKATHPKVYAMLF